MRRWMLMAIALMLVTSPLWAWGSRGHHIINGGAIEALPEPLHSFFERQRGEMVTHAIDPDIWAEHKVMTPPYTHFIDLEYYDEPPFANIPRDYDAAVAKYGADKMAKWGTLPWEIQKRQAALTQAFREERWDDVIREATWLGHYIADSTMPLHTTKDYQGKEAGCVVLQTRGDNRTAHQRIESGLLEHYTRVYGQVRGKPEQVRHVDVTAEIWKDLAATHELVPPSLGADIECSKQDPTLGKGFYSCLEDRIGAPIQGQIAHAEELLASAWLTAWEDAGRPAPPSRAVWVNWPDISAASPRTVHHTAGSPALAAFIPIIAAVLFVALRAGRRRA